MVILGRPQLKFFFFWLCNKEICKCASADKWKKISLARNASVEILSKKLGS
jgi:hypothetical protein